MRAPATIKNWLTSKQMTQWVADAPDPAAWNRRMAIWLTHQEHLHARDVASRLGVSVQAVWLWVRQYNEKGPAGLARKGRGGRHWGFMAPEQEAKLLAPYLRKARSGHITKPSVIRTAVEKHLKRKVSMSYIYRLLRRHGWADILARSHAVKITKRRPNKFESLAMPWQREHPSD